MAPAVTAIERDESDVSAATPSVANSAPGEAAAIRAEPAVPSATTDGAGTVEPVPAIPPFPQVPAFVPLRIERHVAVSRTALTYRLVDGREIEGWGADLYTPRHGDSQSKSSGTKSSDAAETVAEDRAGAGTSPDEVLVGDGNGLSMSAPPHDASALELHDDPGAAPIASAPGRPLIVMLPAGGIRADLTTNWAESFARAGFLALVLHWLPKGADEGVGHSLKGTAKTFHQDAVNLRRTVDWAASLPGVDPRRIGVLGVSRGAIATALVAQTWPELSSVIVLGTADLTGLFRDSDFRVIEKMRTRELERTKGDLDAAVARAAKVLGPVDPASYPGRLDPARTLLINARWDHVFPKPQALALRQAAGGARQEWLPCGHYGTLLFAGRVRRLALEHFEATLAVPATTTARGER